MVGAAWGFGVGGRSICEAGGNELRRESFQIDALQQACLERLDKAKVTYISRSWVLVDELQVLCLLP